MSSHSRLAVVLIALLSLVGGLAAAGPWTGPSYPVQSLLPPGLPGPSALSKGSLDRGVEAFVRGDLTQSSRYLDQLLRSQKVAGKERARGHFLQGWVSSRLGNHQTASSNYYRVRSLEEHPLGKLAAFFEARADLQRGHPQTALAECMTYRERWPEGPHAGECLLVEADAYIALGKFEAAAGRYEQFLADKPDDKRLEPIRVRIAQALEGAGRWNEAAGRFRSLYLHHQLPTTAQSSHLSRGSPNRLRGRKPWKIHSH